jgi:hypothetical protein
MMMDNQDIIDKAPDGATHIDGDEYLDANSDSYWSSKKSKWCALCELILQDDIRSLADIRRIVELEEDLNIAKSIIIKTADNIIEADNCEQDSDEMNEWWDCLKEFALIATGRCDT